MARDDDTSMPGRRIRPGREELEFARPEDKQIEEVILKITCEYPDWGRLEIHAELVRRCREAVVNYVLREHKPARLNCGS